MKLPTKKSAIVTLSLLGLMYLSAYLFVTNYEIVVMDKDEYQLVQSAKEYKEILSTREGRIEYIKTYYQELTGVK